MNSREFERLKVKRYGQRFLQGFIWEIEAPGDGLLFQQNYLRCKC